MISLATKTITSPISQDIGSSNIYLGKFESTLELFQRDNGSYLIEWDIPFLEDTEHIGIYVEPNSKKVVEYDGVFELSPEHVEFLKENGFDTANIEINEYTLKDTKLQ